MFQLVEWSFAEFAGSGSIVFQWVNVCKTYSNLMYVSPARILICANVGNIPLVSPTYTHTRSLT